MNAQDELTFMFDELNLDVDDILCADITISQTFEVPKNYVENKKQIKLKKKFSMNDFADFIDKLDFNYNPNRKNKCELTGYVWFTDGSWLERAFTHNNKWEWIHMSMPEIDDDIK